MTPATGKHSQLTEKTRYSIQLLSSLRNINTRVRFRKDFRDFIANCTGKPYDCHQHWEPPSWECSRFHPVKPTSLLNYNGQVYRLIPVSTVPWNSVPLPIRVVSPAGDEGLWYEKPSERSPQEPSDKTTTENSPISPTVLEDTDSSSYESSSIQISICPG